METMIDDVLMSKTLTNPGSRNFDLNSFEDVAEIFRKCCIELLDDYRESRSFTTLHEVLLGIELQAWDFGGLLGLPIKNHCTWRCHRHPRLVRQNPSCMSS